MSDDKAAVQPESDESDSENSVESPVNGSSAESQADTRANSDAGVCGPDGIAEEHSNDGAGVDANVGDEAAGDDALAGLQAQLESAQSKADENMDLALRTRAEMENLRKRQARELENAHKYSLDKIAAELLPVRDTLELGVAAADEEQAELSKIVEGTELTLKMLTQALEKFNIVEVDPVGDKFNPDLHQAISVQEGTDKPANTVLNVMQKGYTLNDRLIRPAMVVIAK